MIVPMLAAVLLLQGAEVTASVDKTRLRVGEELTLTIRARSRAADPVEILLPSLNGFGIVGSRDMTEVAINGAGAGGSVRTTVRELQLRAQQAGALLIGPVRARQGPSVVSTDPILVTVDSAADRTAATLSPLARSMLESTAPPLSHRADRVALTMLVPSDTVYAGQQVDLIAAAWIPRELGERMRRPPLLTLVTPEGVWAYPVAASSGAALSRQVGGHTMDLFIAHQVVFPLTAGRLIVPPASVEYALPVTFSFFSREERYALRSDSLAITVLPLPPAPPTQATTLVGEKLSLDLQVEPASTRVGEPVEASITVTGVGNVALWPEPPLKWPTGFRAYPAETEMRIEPQDGRVAGSKTFHFLAVPDSSGNFVLPEVRYPYFDATAGGGRYLLATAAAHALAVAPGAEPRAARVLPPLLPSRGERAVDNVSRRLRWEGWLAIIAIPPLFALLVRRRRRRVPAASAARPSAALTPLGELEREFLNVLKSYVSDPFARDGDGLAQALRAAGVDSAVADHVKRLRDRLRAARYGPRGLGDAAELAAEIQQVLRVLGAEGSLGAGARRPHALVTLLVLAIGVATLRAQTAVPSQTASAEALFEAGALRAAADSFAARAARAPRDPANWYNLGATLYRAGADGKATAAWTRAARLAPRDATIRRSLKLLPAPDPLSEQLLGVGFATPAEWGVVAATGWLLLWMVVAFGGRRLLTGLFAAVAITASVLGGVEWRRRDRPVAVVIAESVPVRAAPYGGASAATTLQAGGALLIDRTYGPWVEVHRQDGIHGWVLGEEIAGL